ncbi:MAG: class I SAM-dependent methyltransferase [Chitinophagales bacterium]|nr:class I SAM-dependent methyltransferase [Chitinophagales bacterium]
MQLGDLLEKGLSWLHYVWDSKTKYKIHSPFVFNFDTKVLENDFIYPEYKSIEKFRKGLAKNQTVLNVTDLGAGSKSLESSKRTVAEILETSTKKPKYSQLQFRIVRYFQSKKILELGTSLGITTAYLSKASNEGQIYTIEGCPEIAAKAKQHFEQLELHNIIQKNGNFDDILGEVLNEMGSVDMVFFDGNHKHIPTVNYFEQVLPYCHNDTVLIFDDIYWSEEMEEAWAFIKNHERITLTIDIFEMGLAFLRKESLAKEHFRVWY